MQNIDFYQESNLFSNQVQNNHCQEKSNNEYEQESNTFYNKYLIEVNVRPKYQNSNINTFNIESQDANFSLMNEQENYSFSSKSQKKSRNYNKTDPKKIQTPTIRKNACTSFAKLYMYHLRQRVHPSILKMNEIQLFLQNCDKKIEQKKKQNKSVGYNFDDFRAHFQTNLGKELARHYFIYHCYQDLTASQKIQNPADYIQFIDQFLYFIDNPTIFQGYIKLH